ncbi:ProA domain protein, partial [Bacillus cereus]|nr:ProA domain protein [Bacillus cereus]
GNQLQLLPPILTNFKEKQGVELSTGALIRVLMDIDYILFREERNKSD